MSWTFGPIFTTPSFLNLPDWESLTQITLT